MADQHIPPEVQALSVPAPARGYLLGNLAKAREAKAAKAAERKLEKEAADAAEKEFSMPRKPGESQSSEGPSLEKVQELESMYPRVSVDIRQIIGNKAKGHNENYIVETRELYAFNKHLEAFGGGGRYKCRVRNPDNLGELLMVFFSEVAGPPKMQAPAPQSFAMPVPPPMSDPLSQPQFVAAPQVQFQPQTQPQSLPTVQDPMQYPPGSLPPLPPQYRTLTAEQQWAFYMSQQAMQQRQGGTYSSDQIAMHQNNLLMQEKGRLEAHAASLQIKYDAQARETEQKIAGLRTELERSREDERKRADKLEMELREERLRSDAAKRDAEHKAEMAALHAKLDKLSSAPAVVAKPETNNTVALITAAAPILTAFWAMNDAKNQAEKTQALENTKLLLGTMKKDSPGIEGEAMKYMVEILKSRADEKVAQTESTVMMLGAVTQMMKDMSPEAEPAWMEFAKIALAGVAPGLQAMMTKNVALPGDAPQRNLPQGDKTEIVVPSLDEQRAIQQWQIFKAANEEVAKIVFAAYQHPMMPPEMHTAEWRLIIFNLHMRVDVDKHVMLFVDHLEVQRQLNLLPQALTNIFEKPQAVFEPILKAFPIWSMDQEYAQTFLDEVVAEITDREEERLKVEAEEAEEEAKESETVIVS